SPPPSLLDALPFFLTQLGQLLTLPSPVTGDVEHEAAPVTGLPVHGQTRELLERLQHLAVPADQLLQVTAARVADDRYGGVVGLDNHVDVAVEVGDVEQALQVVRSDFTLLLQAGQGVSALG